MISLKSNLFAEDFHISQNTYGNPGIVDMPIAGSFPDGQIAVSTSFFDSNLKNTLSFQALPNVFATFRYSGIGDKKIGYHSTSGYATWDRSFDLRLDILKNQKLLPDLTVGLQDLIGTGIYSGEYFVASKTILNSFRSSLGLGWGRLASSNIIGKNGKRNEGGPFSGGPTGGLLRNNVLFRGDVGIFGGIEYKPKYENLKFNMELSSDNYTKDKSYSSFSPKSKINYGVTYTPNDSLQLSGFFLHGNKVGIQLDVMSNPSDANGGDFLEKAPQPFYSIPIPKNQIKDSLWKNIQLILDEENVEAIGYKINDDEFTIIIKNYHYSTHSQSVGRTLRILSRFVPSQYKKFTIILSDLGLPITKMSFDRNEIAYIVDAPNAEILTKKIREISGSKAQIEDAITGENYPTGAWRVRPYYRFHLFDPDNPVYYDFGPRIQLTSLLKPGVFLRTTLEQSLVTDFDKIYRGEKGNIPKVRTGLSNYLNTTGPRIRDLMASSYFKLDRNIYGRFSLGYFEPMYAGLSVEFLHMPIKSHFALGAELNYVKARSFKQDLSFREVNGLSKINGHFSAYLDTGFYDYIGQLDIGKYLAGDKGGTLTMTRSFANGWNVGGFFTLTNVSYTDFGEGSFDKGFFIKIPLNSISPYETRASITEKIRPIQGDGGARLILPGRLYELYSDYSASSIDKSWARVWR